MKLKEDRRRADLEMQNQFKQIKTERSDTRRKIEADKQRFELEKGDTLFTCTLCIVGKVPTVAGRLAGRRKVAVVIGVLFMNGVEESLEGLC
mmetsp:Transcript_80/g.68  ORF Transcript_80/g.68 Transcript_80/m.68 type:complete len:92 (+) Transcript_80:323-598(+)